MIMARQPLVLLLIDDERASYDIVSDYCKKNQEYDIEIRWLDEVTGDPNTLKLEEIDIILLDYHIHDKTGIDMLAILDKETKTLTQELSIPVIMFSNTNDITVPARGMMYGISSYIPKASLSAAFLNQTINDVLKKHQIKLALEIKADVLEHQVQYDELTGVYNRFAFFSLLKTEISRSARHKHGFTLFYFDVNKVKTINDTYGHAIGDKILQTLSERLKKILRNEDILARIGGDEFVLLCPELSSEEEIMSVLRRVKSTYADGVKINTANKVISYSLSIGYAIYPDDAQNHTELLEIADQRMYANKHKG